MSKAKKSGVVRPSLFWFLLLDGGIVILARLALSGGAYEQAAGWAVTGSPRVRSSRSCSSARR